MAKLSTWLKFGGTFVLGGVAGALLMWHLSHVLPEELERGLRDPRWYSAVGTWTGVLLAVAGFTRWQTKHDREKISAAALEALPATDHFMEHLEYLAFSVSD